MIAPYLTSLQERLKPHGIQVGSYPVLYKGVFVSLIGRDVQPKAVGNDKAGEKVWLAEVAKEVELAIGGKIASEEEIAAQKSRSATPEVPEAAPVEEKETITEGVDPPEHTSTDNGGKAKY